MVSWSPCGQYLASGGADGAVCLWDVHSRKVYSRMKNEDGIGITALEWDPRGRDVAGQQVHVCIFLLISARVWVFRKVVRCCRPGHSTCTHAHTNTRPHKHAHTHTVTHTHTHTMTLCSVLCCLKINSELYRFINNNYYLLYIHYIIIGTYVM